MDGLDLHDVWAKQEHAEHFRGWDRFSTARIISFYSQFNECQMVRTLAHSSSCRSVADVGCATGRFYRLFRNAWPSIEYRGFDISPVAIDHAKKLYPAGNFSVFDGTLKSPPEIASDLVFCRDVVHHQPNPVEFLSNLYDISGRYLVLRVRTRETGQTVFSVDQSCQYMYGSWAPYIVFNTSELIDLVKSFQPAPAKIELRRHPIILGGQSYRFVPKELYYPDTDTAETAVLIEKGTGQGPDATSVNIETRPEIAERSRLIQILKRFLRQRGL